MEKVNREYLEDRSQRSSIVSTITVFLPFIVGFLIVFSAVSHYSSSTSSLSARTNHVTLFSEQDTSCPTNVLDANCSTSAKPVLGGVDMVQYFTDFKNDDGTYNESYVGSRGTEKYSSVYNGYIFHFLSQANKELFESSPASYAPQYGGFCSWGVGGEIDYPWDADCLGPSGNWALWTVRDEKLYFFYEENAKSYFMAEPDYYISSGDSRWETWFPSSDSGSNVMFSTNCYVGTGSERGEAISSAAFRV